MNDAKKGTARISPQARRPRQSACAPSRASGSDYATLGSNPRQPPPAQYEINKA